MAPEAWLVNSECVLRVSRPVYLFPRFLSQEPSAGGYVVVRARLAQGFLVGQGEVRARRVGPRLTHHARVHLAAVYFRLFYSILTTQYSVEFY